PAVQMWRQAAARAETIYNLMHLGGATHNFAGTFKTRMPVNGASVSIGSSGARHNSVFGHLLIFLDGRNQEYIHTELSNEPPPAALVTNATDGSTAKNAATYLREVIPALRTNADATQAGLTGSASNGFGTASFASNGYLFNPGSFADGTKFTLVAAP